MKILNAFLLVALLTSCAGSKPSSLSPDQDWLRDGLIVISRPMPAISNVTPTNLFAFLPVQGAHVGTWLVIDRQNSALTLMDGEKVVEEVKGEGFEHLAAGEYELMHKQRSALWYAPDSYFSSRNMSIPAKSDRARYRRGALGEYVLFISESTPIHSGPVWMDEIGGLKLNEEDLSKIYYKLQVGAPIQVK